MASNEVVDPKVTNGFDPSKTSPEDAHKMILQIAEMLGVEDPSLDNVEQALETLFGLVSGDQASKAQQDRAALARMTESEKKACKAQGCRPSEFLRVKNTLSTTSYQKRLARGR